MQCLLAIRTKVKLACLSFNILCQGKISIIFSFLHRQILLHIVLEVVLNMSVEYADSFEF